MNRVLRVVMATAVLLCGLGTATLLGQVPLDHVLVTGQIRKVTFCGGRNDFWSYHFSIKAQAKNVGTRRAIISSGSGVVVYFKIAPSVDELNRRPFAHISWYSSGGDSNPSVPSQIVPPFEIVPPGKGVNIDIDFRAFTVEALKPGPAYILLVADNWPGYSDEYVEKLTKAWLRHGDLWADSVAPPPLLFTVPVGWKKGYCP